MYLLVRYLTASADLPTCFPPTIIRRTLLNGLASSAHTKSGRWRKLLDVGLSSDVGVVVSSGEDEDAANGDVDSFRLVALRFGERGPLPLAKGSAMAAATAGFPSGWRASDIDVLVAVDSAAETFGKRNLIWALVR
jgi:hypothetical protein